MDRLVWLCIFSVEGRLRFDMRFSRIGPLLFVQSRLVTQDGLGLSSLGTNRRDRQTRLRLGIARVNSETVQTICRAHFVIMMTMTMAMRSYPRSITMVQRHDDMVNSRFGDNTTSIHKMGLGISTAAPNCMGQ